MDNLQALQREAMKRVADVIATVQDELTKAQEELVAKYFADPDPMPVFVFQAKDAFAMAAITSYYSACLMAGLKEHAGEVHKAMQDFRDWQRRNPDRMKTPDKQHVPLPSAVCSTCNKVHDPPYRFSCEPETHVPLYGIHTQHPRVAARNTTVSRPAPGDPIRGPRQDYPVRPIRDNPQA